MRTCPCEGGNTPARMRMVVLLPAPLGPRKPTISPAATSNETSSIAVKAPKRLVRCSAAIIRPHPSRATTPAQIAARARAFAPAATALQCSYADELDASARASAPPGRRTALFAHGCTTVPYTNRSQLMLMSESDDLQLGAAAYQEVLTKAKIVARPEITAPVQRVGQRIAAAADKPDYQWEFTVIDDPKQANAFCLPGGKVAVYTGIFPIAHDEAGLAAVIGHEVAHALARHGAERMSQIDASAGRRGRRRGGGGQREPGHAAGDHAGVRPRQHSRRGAAVQPLAGIRSGPHRPHPDGPGGLRSGGGDRLVGAHGESAERGRTPPEWLSTHPSPATRITDLRAGWPEAHTYFKPPGQPVAMLPSIPGRPSSQEASAK